METDTKPEFPNPQRSRLLRVFGSIATIFLLLHFVGIFVRQQPVPSGITVKSATGETYADRLPVEGYVKGISNHVSFTLDYGKFSSSNFRIVAYECIEKLNVNGVLVDLSGLEYLEKCAYYKGFVVDLSPYLVEGTNLIEVDVAVSRGYLKLRFSSIPGGWRIWILLGAILLLFSFLLFLLRPILRLPSAILVLWTIALGVRLLYLHEVEPYYCSHDYLGHIDYIKRIESTGETPETMACWSCYHPPLYYHLAVEWRHLSGVLWNLPSERSLLYLSLLFDLLYVFSAARIISGTIRSTTTAALAFAVFALWPGVVISSLSVGNDSLVIPLIGATLWQLLEWVKHDRWRNFVLTAIFWSLALNAKSNAIIIGPILVSIYLGRRLWKASWRHPRIAAEIAVGGALVLGAVGFAAYRPVKAYFAEKQDSLLVGNSTSLGSKHAVPNDLEHLFGIDVFGYFEEPYIWEWGDPEAAYFPNYYAKTSLFGEHRWLGDKLREAGPSRWLLLLLPVLWLGVLLSLRDRHAFTAGTANYLILSVGWLLAAALLYRIYLPFRPCADFRFTAPIAIFIAALGVTGWRGGESSGRLRIWFTRFLVCFWGLAGALFFLALYLPGTFEIYRP